MIRFTKGFFLFALTISYRSFIGRIVMHYVNQKQNAMHFTSPITKVSKVFQVQSKQIKSSENNLKKNDDKYFSLHALFKLKNKKLIERSYTFVFM